MSVSDQFVNRNPAQLLRFLGMSGPDSPNRVLDGITGTLDLFPWWLAAAEQDATGIVTPAAAFTGTIQIASLIVPAGQRWLITAFTIATNALVAAHTYKMAAVYTQNVVTTYVLGTPETAIGLEVFALDGFQGIGRNGWILLGPGDFCAPLVMGNTGATPAQITVKVRYCSFPA